MAAQWSAKPFLRPTQEAPAHLVGVVIEKKNLFLNFELYGPPVKHSPLFFDFQLALKGGCFLVVFVNSRRSTLRVKGISA